MEEPQVGDLVEIVITGRVTDKFMGSSDDPKRLERVLTVKTDAVSGEHLYVRFDGLDVTVRQLQAR
jgi:hypothetical protein